MTKVHKILVGSLAVLISLFLLSLLSTNHYFKPHFVTNAETRLQSYLSASFGQVNCKSESNEKQIWKTVCHGGFKDKRFEYLVKKVDGDTSYDGEFSLVAMNDNARISKNIGLLTYLNIN